MCLVELDLKVSLENFKNVCVGEVNFVGGKFQNCFQNDAGSSNQTNYFSKTNNRRCYNHGEIGHYIQDCFKSKRNQNIDNTNMVCDYNGNLGDVYEFVHSL